MITLEIQLKFLLQILLFCFTFFSNNAITLEVLFEGSTAWRMHESWLMEEFQRGVKWQWGCCCHPTVASTLTVDCCLLLGPLPLLIVVWVSSAALAAATMADSCL